MSRRLSIAMAFSAAIHLVAFLIADHILSGAITPSVISTPLVVSIESPGVTPNSAGTKPMPLVAEAPQPAEMPLPAGEVPPEPGEVLPEVAAANEAPPNPVISAAARGLSSDVPKSDNTDTVVVTIGSEAQRSVLTKTALSAGQKKMLNLKLKEWTEEQRDLPETMAGLSWKHDGQEYRARVSRLPADAETGIERVLVEVSTFEDDQRFSTKFQVKRLAFSSFAQFVNRWDPDVELHDDELDGRFHSNSRFHIAYDGQAQPVFRQLVTTSAHGVAFTRARGRRQRDEIFQGGIETGVRAIRLPRQFTPFSDYPLGDDANVHHLTEDTRITFRPDGSYLSQFIDSSRAGRNGVLSAGTTYFIADKGTAIHVRGTVNGKVLVYSPQRIVIEDDLVYEQDPEFSPDSDDLMGLVSDGNIEVAEARVTGPGDLLVHAAIYAKRKFIVRGIRSRQHALLYLLGSLSTGSLSATEPRYSTKIRFDPRLEEMRPPGFPMTNRYEVELRDANWTVEAVD